MKEKGIPKGIPFYVDIFMSNMGYENIMSLDPKIQSMLFNFIDDSNRVGVYKAENDIMKATGWDSATLYSHLDILDRMVKNGVALQGGKGAENTWESTRVARRGIPANEGITANGQKNTYFQKGSLEDGFSLKNAWKATRATERDVMEDASKMILRGAESTWDFLKMLAMANLEAQTMAGGYSDAPTAGLSKAINNSLHPSAVEQERAVIEKGWNMEESSYLGAKGDAAVQSITSMGIRTAVSAIPYAGPALSAFMTIAETGGAEMEYALQNGAKNYEALTSGLISGGLEYVIEKATGLSLGGKTILPDVATLVAKRIPNKFFGILAKFGLTLPGEGTEEGLTYLGQQFGRWLTYQREVDLKDMFNKEDFWDNVIAGFIMAGLFGAADIGTQTQNFAKSEKSDNIWLTEYDKLTNKDDVAANDDRSSLQGESSVSARPTWRQSETDVGDLNPSYQAQKSFLNGKEVPYATRGSSRPDYYSTGSSIEVKNYNVMNITGRNSLINTVSNQVNKRGIDLPSGTKQTIIIDVRGQHVSNDILRQIRTSILGKCNTDVIIQFMR